MNRIMFVLAIGCAQVAMSATWTDQSTGITWTYTAHGTKATLGEWTTDWHGDPIVKTAVSKTFSGNLVIPSSINGLTVDSICNEGFWGCTGISSITIPEGVTDIGKRAFYGCTGLVNVILPSTVESLDGSAFENCVCLYSFEVDSRNENFKAVDKFLMSKDGSTLVVGVMGGSISCDVKIPDGVTRIGECAFLGRKNLGSITIPTGVTCVERAAFMYCTRLTAIIIPSNVEIIGAEAFECCENLSSLTISDGVAYIGDYAFFGCGQLTSVTIPGSVESIGESAFDGCDDLISVTIEEGVKNIEQCAFRDCLWLKTVTLPSSLATMGIGVFLGCPRITSVTMPVCVQRLSEAFPDAYQSIKKAVITKGVSNVRESAFMGCSSLTSITVDSENTEIKAVDGLLLSKDGKRLMLGMLVNGQVTIPDGVENICSNAFSYCSALKSVVVPQSVKMIEKNAFTSWSSAGVKITSFVVDANNETYMSANGLLLSKDGTRVVCGVNGDVIVPEGVVEIEDNAFFLLDDLYSVSLPSTLMRIGKRAFADTGLWSVTIPEGVTIIDERAFDLSYLRTVAIPSSVKSIGEFAFDCEGLKEVRITDLAKWCEIEFGGYYANPTEFAHGLWLNGAQIQELNIPEGVKSISSYAFYNCNGITSVTIPQSLEKIGDHAFDGCFGLRGVYIGNLTSWCAIDFGDNPLPLARHLFLDGNAIRDLVIPEDVTSIGRTAFCGCDDVLTVTIPPSVTEIGVKAFRASNITTIYVSVGDSDRVKSLLKSSELDISRLNFVEIGESFTVKFDANGGTVTSAEKQCGIDTPVGALPTANFPGYLFEGWFTSITGGEVVTSETKIVADTTFYAHWGVDYSYYFTIEDGALVKYIGGGGDVEIPPSVTTIAKNAFSGCKTLVSVSIPDGVTNISEKAFFNCSSLKKVTISSTVSNVGSLAFGGCSGLAAFTVDSANAVYKSVDGLLMTKDGKVIVCGIMGDVIVPEGVEVIGDSAFYAISIGSVTLPTSLINIGERAFYECKGLRDVEISEGVKDVGKEAFYDCEKLTSVIFPNGLTNIADYAFCGCEKLTEVTIPTSVVHLGNCAFCGGGMTSVTIWPRAIEIGWGAFSGCRAIETLKISDGVRELYDTFYDSRRISTVVFLDGTTNIGRKALTYNGDSCLISSVYIPNSVTNIGDYAFSNCNCLETVDIPESVTSMGKGVFWECDRLTSLVTPAGISEVREFMFYGCGHLKEVTIPKGVEHIGEQAFYGCDELRLVHVDKGDTSRVRGLFAESGVPVDDIEFISCANRVVTFDPCGGTTGCVQKNVEEDSAIGELPEATRTGYGLLGWFTAENGGERVTPETIVVDNVTFYARWVGNPYGIHFDANGGEGEMPDVACIYDVSSQLFSNLFTRSGYVFVGWSTSSAGEVEFEDGAPVRNLASDSGSIVTLYAKWAPIQYLVRFSADGAQGTMRDEQMTYDVEKKLQANGFVRTGYTFLGWAAVESGDVMFVDRQDVKNLTSIAGAVINLYAKWVANGYEVKFDANGGSGTMTYESMTYDAAKALTACAFTRKGYTFAGWATSAGGAVKYADGATVKNLTATAGGTVTLYAKWTPNNYVIGFNPGQGGTGTMSDQPMTYDEEMALYANLFARTGYTFLGWTDDESELEEVLYYDGVVVSNLTDEVDGEYDLYAVWAANEYTVRFNANGGEGTMSDQEFLYDEEQNLYLNCFTRVGHSFVGWARSAKGAVAIGDGGSASNLTAEADGLVTLYAQWSANPYTVKFDANGGEGEMSDMDCTYGVSKQLAFNSFTRVGYAFAGWATSAKGEVVYANGAAIKSIAASGVVTLYAKWTAISYSVKFNANGGSGSMANEAMTYDAEKMLTACAFTRTGYTFASWATSVDGEVTYADGQAVKNLTATQSMVVNLYAKWTANAYMVKFNANGGKGTMADEPFTYDAAAKALTTCAFTRTGYTFAGWATSADGAVEYANGATVKNLTATAGGTVTLYAKWTPNKYVIDFNPGQGGEGSMSDQSMIYDEAEALYPNLFHRTGYTFLGWTDDEGELEEVLFYDGVVVSNLTDEVDGEYDLYAIWTANEYTVKFDANGGKGTMADQAFLYDEVQNLTSNGFTRAGCDFLGWATSAVGGVVYADGEAVSNLTAEADGVVNLYAVWDGTATTWMEDADFSAAVANTYDGYLIDEEFNLVGVVQVKTTKQTVKKSTDRKTKVVTVTTNITATATVTDANGKKWSYSKGSVEIKSGASLTSGRDSASPLVGVVTGLKCTTKGCPAPEFGVTLGKNGMKGVWGEYVIFGARNGLGTKGDAMMAALEAYKGKWSVTIGALRLQLNVQAKGVVKIAGNWESGAKVSASAQMIMGDGFAYVPVMVKQTKTSPALNALLRIDANGEVALLSEGELVAGGRTVEALGEPVYLPSEVSVGGKAFGARVAVNELAYPVKFAAKKLPAGLKIDAATGVISGTPTKPGHYVAEVTVTSGLNSKVKKTLTVEFDIANYTDDLIPIEDAYGPYYVGVSAAEQIAAAAGCTASGLPSGLKWTAKDIVDTKTKALKTAANTVYGIPTKACTNTVYFKKTVKETVDGKTKSVTHQVRATFIVEGMKPWAVGEFNGGSTNGMVTLTVAKTGKISGKWMSEGLTWTLSAASFDAYDAEREAYHATVTAKSGKETKTLELVHKDGYICASLTSGKDSASPLWEAWRNGWKEEPQKTLATKLKGQKVSVGEALLTVGASGTVTAKGTFVTGFDEKKQKDITYSASCSTVLIPTEEDGWYKVYLYFPPKSGKFDGFSACESVMFAP